MVRRPPASPAWLLPCFRAVVRLTRVPIAGSVPNSRPVTRETSMVKPSTTGSRSISPVRCVKRLTNVVSMPTVA